MQLTELEIRRELEQARREGNWGEVEELEILLAVMAMKKPAPAKQEPARSYTLEDGDDPFVVSEREMGSVEHAPKLLRSNPTSQWKPGTEIKIPPADKFPLQNADAGALVDLFETKGAPGDNWTADDWAVLEAVREQPATPADEEEADAEAGIPEDTAETTVAAEEEEAAPQEHAKAAAEAEAGLKEELELPEVEAEAVAQAVAEMLFGMGMPDPVTWSPVRVGVPEQGPQRWPAGQGEGGDGGEGETEEWQAGGSDYESPEVLKDWETIKQASEKADSQELTVTPTVDPGRTIQHTVLTGNTILGLVSEYGISLDNLEAANPFLANRLAEGRTLLEIAYIEQGGENLLFIDDVVAIPAGLANDFESSSFIQSHIKEDEKLIANPYNDPADNCSVGYGHLIHYEVCDGRLEEEQFRNITLEQAEELFETDIYAAEQAVKAVVNVKLNQDQFDALVSFVYNVGPGNLLGSDLLGYLNKGDYSRVPEEIARFVYGNDKEEYGGLKARREFEAALFSGEFNE